MQAAPKRHNTLLLYPLIVNCMHNDSLSMSDKWWFQYVLGKCLLHGVGGLMCSYFDHALCILLSEIPVVFADFCPVGALPLRRDMEPRSVPPEQNSRFSLNCHFWQLTHQLWFSRATRVKRSDSMEGGIRSLPRPWRALVRANFAWGLVTATRLVPRSVLVKVPLRIVLLASL